MSEDRRSALARREIVASYVVVPDRHGELVEVCSAVEVDAEQLRIAVQEAFGLSEMAADAVLVFQVRRFAPTERLRIQNELADLDQWLETSSRA